MEMLKNNAYCTFKSPEYFWKLLFFNSVYVMHTFFYTGL